MGHNSCHASAFLVISLVLLATATPLAHGQGLIGGLLQPIGSIILLPVGSLLNVLNPILSLIRGLIVTGNLCCTPTGNCPPGGAPPLVGALVNLNCTRLLGGVPVVLGQGTTNANGTFVIAVNNLLSLPAVLLSSCTANVQLPLNQTICTVLSTVNGTVNGVTNTLTTVLTGVLAPISLLVTGLLQFVANLVVTVFVSV